MIEALMVTGSIATIALLVLQMFDRLATDWLFAGPAIVLLSLGVAALAWTASKR